MPSPPPKPCGSPSWFHHLPLPQQPPDRPAFTAEHRLDTPKGRSLAYQQIFDADRLIAWIPDHATGPDVVLTRSKECDAGDLLGRLPATEVAQMTSITVGHKTTDLFGAAAVDRPGLDQHTAGTIDIGLVALNTPFGDVEAAIRLRPDGTQRIMRTSDADCEATVRAEWADLMDWMHKNTRMGHLMHQQRVEIEGSLTVMSYAEGHIRWPKTPQDQAWSTQFLNTMMTYAHYRLSAEYLDLMDQIEETTE